MPGKHWGILKERILHEVEQAQGTDTQKRGYPYASTSVLRKAGLLVPYRRRIPCQSDAPDAHLAGGEASLSLFRMAQTRRPASGCRPGQKHAGRPAMMHIRSGAEAAGSQVYLIHLERPYRHARHYLPGEEA